MPKSNTLPLIFTSPYAFSTNLFSLFHIYTQQRNNNAESNPICMHKHFKSHGLQQGVETRKCSFLKMKLVAEVLTGTLFYVEVGEDATVGDLKKQIGRQEKLPTDRLILMLNVNANERPLLDKDWVSLKDYEVRDASHIYIFFEPLDNSSLSSDIEEV